MTIMHQTILSFNLNVNLEAYFYFYITSMIYPTLLIKLKAESTLLFAVVREDWSLLREFFHDADETKTYIWCPYVIHEENILYARW